MNVQGRRKCLCFGVVLLGSMSLIFAGPGGSLAQSSKKVGQLNFQVPDDWPVEKRGGLMTPVPTEEYVSIKFREIEKEFQSVRDEFSAEFTGFQTDLKNIEEDLLKEIQRSQSEDGSQEGPGGNRTEILSDIESLKSELGRLDRKITNKVKEMQAELEKINPQMESIQDNIDDLQKQIYRIDEKIDFFHEE